ncbi:MAG: HypC/HybG/HupF family hydrogenase formation chaperone [Nitrospirae bacterium]|nr:HypC/HybG/HupF family hydrogenase formation chaperone [Nitrospirota bacterium]
MCLAIPSRIISKNNLLATVDVYGAKREINLMLLPEDAEIGDYVLVHVGFAIQKVDKQGAEEALVLLREIAEAGEGQDSS